MEEYLMRMMVCGTTLVESFKSHRTHTKLRQLSISTFYTCAAPNSGPIALLFRKYEFKQLKLPDQLDCSVLLYDCRGELIRTIAFDLKQRVILFEFTTDQHLLIVYASGTYFILDTATGTFKSDSYFLEDDLRGKGRATGAIIINDKILILRGSTLGVVEELDGKWQPLYSIKIHPDWPVFDAFKKGPLSEIKVVYLTSSYQIETCGIGKYDRGQVVMSHPELRNICPILIKIGMRENKLVLVFTNFLLWVDTKEDQKVKDKGKISVNGGTLSQNSISMVKDYFGDRAVFFDDFKVDKEDPLSKTTSSNKYRNFYSLGWLSNEACYFSDRIRVFISSFEHPQVVKVPAGQNGFILAQGNDIARVIEDYTFVLRSIDDPIYLALAGHSQLVQPLLSHNPSQAQNFGLFSQLLFLFENAVEKRPNQIQRLKKLQGKIGGVLDCLLQGASRSLDAGMQLRVMRFAQWVQTVSGQQRDFRELAKRLRVVNGLRYEHLSRWLSLNEFQHLRTERFLTMLLRSNMHYVADLIFEDSASKRKIFLHWGKCKIEKEQPLAAVQQIQLRYADMKRDLHSKFVFTQLALYALRRRTPLTDLALRLAENEPHPARKCMVFLLAFKGKGTPELVDKLLDFAEQSFCTGALYRTLSTLKALNEVPRDLWIQLLPKRPFLESFYLRVLRAEGNSEDLKIYLETTKKYADLAQLTLAKQLREKEASGSSEVAGIVQANYSKLLPNLTSQIARCKKNTSLIKLRDLKNKRNPITEQQTKQFSKDGQLEALGEIIEQKDGNIALSVSCWKRIKGEKVYEILKVKARPREAMEIAFERNDRIKLAQLVEEADQDVAQVGQSMLKELVEGRG